MKRAYNIIQGDCLEVMPTLPDNSVNLICTDPPYYRVKNEPWDRQWDTAEGFLDWFGLLCNEWQRLLKPNGSLYVFAATAMAAEVQCVVKRSFSVVNRITWRKPPFSTKAEMFRKSDLHSYFPTSEAIIFAEREGFIFESLRTYLDGEKLRAGWSTRRVAEEYQKLTGSRTVTGMASHWFGVSQWELPTAENYQWLRDLFNSCNGGGYLTRDHEDLRAEYKALRRPFFVTADVPYTDVWDFPTVQAYAGKHPCEKPLAMMEHIVTASSREGDTVLDCFCGSGATGEAAVKHGREFVGIELSEEWCQRSEKRAEEVVNPVQLSLEPDDEGNR